MTGAHVCTVDPCVRSFDPGRIFITHARVYHAYIGPNAAVISYMWVRKRITSDLRSYTNLNDNHNNITVLRYYAYAISCGT